MFSIAKKESAWQLSSSAEVFFVVVLFYFIFLGFFWHVVSEPAISAVTQVWFT